MISICSNWFSQQMPSLFKRHAVINGVICSGKSSKGHFQVINNLAHIRKHQLMKHSDGLLRCIALVTGTMNSLISDSVIIRVLLWPLITLLTLASHVQAYNLSSFTQMENLEGFNLHIWLGGTKARETKDNISTWNSYLESSNGVLNPSHMTSNQHGRSHFK